MLSWIELLNVKHTFDMKLKTYKEKENLKERGTKRYQERKVQEQEAEEEIKNYKDEKEDTIDNDSPPTYP
jgi:hypothetical protein